MSPNCVEIKHFLNGEERRFLCKLIHFNEGFGVLEYILEQAINVSSLTLPAGTVTYGFYWIDRSYTLYRWFKNSIHLGSYFNIADRILLKTSSFEWRDLTVDILILPNDILEVLDEDELPDNISYQLKKYIFESRDDLLINYNNILSETDEILKKILK